MLSAMWNDIIKIDKFPRTIRCDSSNYRLFLWFEYSADYTSITSVVIETWRQFRILKFSTADILFAKSPSKKVFLFYRCLCVMAVAADAICDTVASISLIKFGKCGPEFQCSSPLLIFSSISSRKLYWLCGTSWLHCLPFWVKFLFWWSRWPD